MSQYLALTEALPPKKKISPIYIPRSLYPLGRVLITKTFLKVLSRSWRATISLNPASTLVQRWRDLGATPDATLPWCLFQWGMSSYRVRRGTQPRSMAGLSLPNLIRCDPCHFPSWVTVSSFVKWKLGQISFLYSLLWIRRGVCFPQKIDVFIHSQKDIKTLRHITDLLWK